MKTVTKLLVIVAILAISIGACGKNENNARDCSDAAREYIAAINKLSADPDNDDLCRKVQNEVRALYKDCKAYMGGGITEDDINTMCD